MRRPREPYAVAPAPAPKYRPPLGRILVIIAGLAAIALTVVAYAAWRVAGIGPS